MPRREGNIEREPERGSGLSTIALLVLNGRQAAFARENKYSEGVFCQAQIFIRTLSFPRIALRMEDKYRLARYLHCLIQMLR